jgi:glycosyltransferase involved in cell wall biosynthesis
MRILAIIPAYNEEDALATTVRELVDCCPSIDYLVVNDGSSDNTERVCLENGIRHITLPVNTGLSSAVRTGMKYARRNDYDAVVQFDADGQHLPEYILPMARALESDQADIVIASRVLAGEAPVGLRNVGSKLISWLIRIRTGTTITDPTSGMRMYNRDMIKLFATDFDVHPEPDFIAYVAKHGGRITEIPAHVRERQGGESYLGGWKVVTYMMRTTLSILLYQWLR